MLSSAQGKYNVHLGDEDQTVDDIMAKYLTAGTIPAYRGMAYVVIEDFPLAEYGNRIPNFTFEVRRSVKFTPSVEDKIKDIVIIPGAGEMVYGTNVTTKQDGYFDYGGAFTPSGSKDYINMHNYDGKADVLVAVDQLLKVLPNLEWVAVVVTWFATSTDAGTCEIIPKIEFQGTTQVLPQDWAVAGYTRSTAQKVLFFDEETPTYGGTPSDHTVVQIVDELKARGLNVMLYPMPFVDTITPVPKPWRGRIEPANATDAASWFTKTNGYNAFITHYANLVKNKVDAFVIGSELIGMTGYTDTPGIYPAVSQLVSLAATVKGIMGGSTDITYADDWSEYHSTDGWFNLDPLWASSNIDFVGIDSYFPITEDLPQIQIDEDKIKEYWEKGEGWDYYWNGDRSAQTSYGGDPTYAWKNLEHWWNSTHTNPDSSGTSWTAKMKPVWFTEFGFPSVDGCANQPNVFYDPTSSESYYPRGSKGRVDFQAQREALNATLDYLDAREQEAGNANLVPRRFLWTWDARPFSFWPDLESVWQDSILWATGHWVQGKLGNSTLGAIVGELLQAAGLTASDYDFYTPPGETSSNLQPPVLVPGTLVQFIDAPPLPTDTSSNQALLRIGVAADGANWNGAAIYRSDDGGEAGGNTFQVLAGLDGAATFGAIITNLAAGPFETWDRVNEVEVILTAGSLASVSELAVLNGANAALIGNELIQFENAQLIGENTYKLTKLLRGRQGTEWAIGTHAAGERFLATTPALYTTAIANNLIGRQLFYKGVSVGNSLGNTDELAFTYAGRNLKPFAPVHVTGLRNGFSDLTISWIRRSRVDAEWRDGVGIPLGEESELYEVDILDGSTVVRTIESISPTASYSAADQTTDFGSAQSSIDVKVYQLSAVIGRGYAVSATV